MQKFRLIQWCESATRLICFGPDRKAVAAELLAHLEDHRDALMEQGLEEREATGMALESMGDPSEIAADLAKIHRPFWGYFLRVSKILLLILLVLCIWPVWDYITDLNLWEQTAWQRQFDVFDSASYGADTGRILHHLSEPDVSFTADGSTFTLTDAVLFSNAEETDEARMLVRIRQKTTLPWTEHKEYLSHFYPVTVFFTARDNLGNEYRFFNNQDPEQPTRHTLDGAQRGIFTYMHELWINDFPQEAQWVEICYTRDGRDYALRVYLTGGDHT